MEKGDSFLAYIYIYTYILFVICIQPTSPSEVPHQKRDFASIYVNFLLRFDTFMMWTSVETTSETMDARLGTKL